MNWLIKNAFVVNQGAVKKTDVLIRNGLIEQVGDDLKAPEDIPVLDAGGKYLLPGVIDAQVHFREPGLTHKATIYTESKAAVAGGITSYMEMPNTIPNTLTQELLEEKYGIAAKNSLANYSFFMGVNGANWDEAIKTNPRNVCGITDDGLYFSGTGNLLCSNPAAMEQIFSESKMLVTIHSEDESMIEKNLETFKLKYGEDIPV
ncbi:MAG: amidohydrolase family protein, partial [Daejeonella sp.]